VSNLSNVERGNLLEKAAEIGKDVWNAGTKLGNLFKSSSKPGKESGDCKADFESESVTSCEATTSFQDDKPKSSSRPSRADLVADADDENDEDFQHTKKHKKKKKKHKKRRDASSDTEGWEEKTRENLDKFKDEKDKRHRSPEFKKNVKESFSNPDAPVKKWNSKPELKTIGRSVTWDGSKGSNVVEELLKGSEIRSWSGDRSTLERKLGTEPRKRSAGDDLDAEMDAGKVKKVKKHPCIKIAWSEIGFLPPAMRDAPKTPTTPDYSTFPIFGAAANPGYNVGTSHKVSTLAADDSTEGALNDDDSAYQEYSIAASSVDSRHFSVGDDEEGEQSLPSSFHDKQRLL